MSEQAQAGERGRRAGSPSEIPKAGWRDILKRVSREQSADNISMVAAGVAFYGLLAVFPALAATISIYGMFADPGQIQGQIQAMSGMLPGQVQDLLQSQLTRLVSGSGGALGIGAIVGIVVALWSAAAGVKALMTALDIAYDEREERSFVRFNGLALLLTLGTVVTVIVALALIVVLPAVLGNLGLGGVAQTAVSWVRWLLLAAGMIAALGILYRVAPDRDQPEWRWVSWGSVGATALWIIASVLFSWYVSNFGSYNQTYGSLAAVVILMLWFWISAYVILLGAELNAEMEHQTRRDTTAGEPQPMGERDAYAADTLGKRQDGE